MSGRRVEASLGHVSRCPWGLVVVRVKAAPPPPTSGLCPWGAAVDFGSSNLPSDSLALLGFLSSITCSGRVSCRSPVVALGSFGMWWVSPPCCGAVISVFGDFCCLWSRSVRYVFSLFTGELGGFGISISKSYVFSRLRSPCSCDSDGRLDCCRSPVVFALDGMYCVGGVPIISVAVLSIVVELSGLVAELPVAVARRLSWRTLYIIFKSLPSSIISCAIHVRTFPVSCWEKESGSRMSRKAA